MSTNWKNKILYVGEHGHARRQVEEWKNTRPDDAEQIEKIAQQPQALWFNGERPLIRFKAHATRVDAEGSLPVIVAYNIPKRDVGQYSAGGALTAALYRSWIDDLAETMGDLDCIIILEPDALAHMDQLSDSDVSERLQLMRYACEKLTVRPDVRLYIDAGHPKWHQPQVIAARLREVLTPGVRGFSLNVSNFVTTDDNIAYGEQISRLIDGKPFVIDISRNGLGPKLNTDGSVEWCNPEGRALGMPPTLHTENELVDALLWIKLPGESDGECNGGPKAGAWWPEYALGLAKRTSWEAGLC